MKCMCALHLFSRGTNYATATHQTNVHLKNNIGAECTDKFDELSIMNYEYYISYILL